MIDVAIVLVSFNCEETLRECLDSLVLDPSISHKIIVVDNASTDNTVSILNEYKEKIEIIQSPKNVGFGSGNNLGVFSCDAQYYYLHNTDAYLKPNVLERALATMRQDSRLGMLGLPLVYPDGAPQVSGYSFSSPTKWTLQVLHADKAVKRLIKAFSNVKVLMSLLSKLPFAKNYVATMKNEGATDTIRHVDWIAGASMLISREAFFSVNGFDEGIFLYSEDEDLCRRIRAKGYGIAVGDGEPIIHELGWKKANKKATYSSLKFNSKKYFIDKYWPPGTIKNRYMKMLLHLKRTFGVD